ncbi:hypothetical protein LV476_03730 [Guyparkeria hydrothermalis]|uniref:hypothetical protein n=1 Tax=Guyparkeria hydrothermalis TaxID=923 RepID=UPI002020BBCE|nr:hypothetical protein [Guyparkeria hydrothermalis]MCL7744062.1 hypothetical protein [Guyparkeria hydrothermalis]
MQRRGNQAKDSYVGLDKDRDGGMTFLGRLVLDARVFGLIPEDETCEGWELGRMQGLADRVNAEWDKHGGGIPSLLPDDLRARHAQAYEDQMNKARKEGWDPDANMEED